MSLHNTRNSFGTVTKTFHWLLVVTVLSMLAIGFIMEDMPNGLDKLRLFGRHKATGLTVLVAAVAWMLWRLKNVKPSYPEHLSWLQKRTADSVKYVLLMLLVAMPLTGWLMSSAAGYSVSYFGWFMVPDLVEPNPELRRSMVAAHYYFAVVFIGVIGMHAAAALLHHFYYKDTILRRMLPFTRRENNVQETDTTTGA